MAAEEIIPLPVSLPDTKVRWEWVLLDAGDRRYTTFAVMAVDLEHALAEARKFCRKFTLPGWRVEHNGIAYPAVLFKEDKGAPGNPARRRKRKWM